MARSSLLCGIRSSLGTVIQVPAPLRGPPDTLACQYLLQIGVLSLEASGHPVTAVGSLGFSGGSGMPPGADKGAGAAR